MREFFNGDLSEINPSRHVLNDVSGKSELERRRCWFTVSCELWLFTVFKFDENCELMRNL